MRHDEFEELAGRRVAELGDDIDFDTFSAAFELFRVSARLMQDLETTVHRPLGLSLAGFRILFTVWLFDELEPREIARLSGVSRAAVSGVLNTLEREGLVDRSREQADRRLVTVRLTEDGYDRLRNAYQNQNRREAALFSALDRDQLRHFTALMRTILATQLSAPESAPILDPDRESLRP